MERYSDKYISSLPLNERLDLVNSLLIGSSLKQVINYFEFSKGKLKELLKPYEYNVETKRFELLEVTDLVTDNNVEMTLNEVSKSNYNKSNDNSVIELLADIKRLLQDSYNQKEKSNHIMLQIADDITLLKETSPAVKESELKAFEPKSSDELITRSFKIYESINERLKKATKNSYLNQQQLLNSLLDKALREIEE